MKKDSEQFWQQEKGEERERDIWKPQINKQRGCTKASTKILLVYII